MSLQAYSPKRNRVYVRRFDHEDAVRRFQAGETIAALAAEYDVTYGAVRHAVTPGQKQRQIDGNKRWRTGTCDACGGPAMRLVGGKRENNPDGRCLCPGCRGAERRESVRFGHGGALVAVKCMSLDCASGERWQSPESFGRGKRYRDLREGGFHGLCRPCATRTRRRYRERHKVPCETCGAPCLPPSEKGPYGGDRPRCRPCFYADQRIARTPEATSSEAMPSTREKAKSGA